MRARRPSSHSLAIYYRHKGFQFLRLFTGVGIVSFLPVFGWYAGYFTALQLLLIIGCADALLFVWSLLQWRRTNRLLRQAAVSAAKHARRDDWLSAGDLSHATLEHLNSLREDGQSPSSDGKNYSSPAPAWADPPACFWRWVPSSDEFYFSPGLLALINRPAELISPHLSSWEEFCHPEDRAMSLDKLKACAEGLATNCLFEQRIFQHGGEWLWIRCEVQVVKSKQIDPQIHVTGICHNISAQRKLGDQLTVQDERYRNLLESSQTGFVKFTLSGKILEFNSSFLDMLERRSEEMQTLSLQDLMTEESRPAQDKAFHALRHGAETSSAEIELLGKTGRNLPVVMHVTLESESEQRKVVWAIFRDKSIQASRPPALSRSNQAADFAWQERSRVLCALSHEVRTPLNVVVGMADLALESPSSPEQKDCLQSIRHSAHTLLNIFSDYLDFSKIEAGKLKLAQDYLDMSYLLDRVMSVFTLQAEEKSLAFLTQIEENVPTNVFGDGERLRQIFINLIGNAVRFTPAGGAVIVQMSCDPGQEVEKSEDGREILRLHFTVGDTGVGIPQERLNSIFAPNPSDAEQMNGMGLHVARELVTAMGGKIWVESTPGQGTAFHFTARLALAPQRPSVALSTPRSKQEQLGLRVLLAEDSAVNQKLVMRILKKHGCTVVAANDGEQAIEKLQAASKDKPFDVVLMDCQMPQLDGYAAVARIREMEKSSRAHTPIIALTAHAMEGDRERCYEAGMDEYLSKPLDIDLLLDTLKHWAGQRSAAKAAESEDC